MSLSATSLSRFRQRVDETLDDLFPVTLVISGAEVAGSGPGGRAVSQYVDSGESENFRFPFRIPRRNVPAGWKPRQGLAIDWKVDDSTTIPLEIREVSTRPHEDRFGFIAQKRRVP